MSGHIDTAELLRLLDRTIADSYEYDPTLGVLQAARTKILLLNAAQSAAKAGASQELLIQILDERN